MSDVVGGCGVERGTAWRRRAPRRGCVSSGRSAVPDRFDCLLVGVGVGRAQIDDEAARVGHDVVLGAGRDLRDGDADRTQQLRYALEAEVAEPGDVVECDVERIYPLAAGRMAAPAVGFAVEDDQPPLACCGLHARRLADQRHVDRSQCGSRARMPCSPMHSSSPERASSRLKGRGCSRKVRNVRASDTTEAPASLLPRPYKRSPSMVGVTGRAYRRPPGAPCRGASSAAGWGAPGRSLRSGRRRCCAVFLGAAPRSSRRRR